jgi:hypothetical protein
MARGLWLPAEDFLPLAIEDASDVFIIRLDSISDFRSLVL